MSPNIRMICDLCGKVAEPKEIIFLMHGSIEVQCALCDNVQKYQG